MNRKVGVSVGMTNVSFIAVADNYYVKANKSSSDCFHVKPFCF